MINVYYLSLFIKVCVGVIYINRVDEKVLPYRCISEAVWNGVSIAKKSHVGFVCRRSFLRTQTYSC